jgi:hypothetical protein
MDICGIPVVLTISRYLSHQVKERMQQRLEDHDPTKPPMNQIVRIKRDSSQLNEWIVASSEQEKWSHVHDC